MSEPKSAWWSALSTLVLGISVPAAIGAAIALYSLVDQALDKKSIVTITVRPPPEILEKVGLSKEALEYRLAADLALQFDGLTIPAMLPIRTTLPADLQNIAADAKIEVSGAGFLLRPIAAKIRAALKREDLSIELFVVKAGSALVVLAVTERGGKKDARELAFGLDDNDANIAAFPVELANFVAEVVSPIARVTRIAPEIAACYPNCEALLADLIAASRRAAMSPPRWDDRWAHALWVQFELLQKYERQLPTKAEKDVLMQRLDAAAPSGTDDYSLLMHVALVAGAIGATGEAQRKADAAVLAFAKRHSVGAGGTSNPCTSREKPALSRELRSAFAVLCLSKTAVGIPGRLTIEQAWDETETIRMWAFRDPAAEVFAGMLWLRHDLGRANAIFGSMSVWDRTAIGPTAYAHFLSEHGQPARALHQFARALRASAGTDSREDFLFLRIREVAGRLGYGEISNKANECVQYAPEARYVCRELLAAALEETSERPPASETKQKKRSRRRGRDNGQRAV